MSGFGLIPFGLGYWGIPHPSSPPTNAFVNVINVKPAPGAFNILRNQTFTFTIESRFFINPNTTYVFLDNKLVINGAYFNTTDFNIIVSTNVDGISKDYTITPKYLFKDRAVFTLQISATDVYGNPAPPFWGGYIVADTRPPLLTPIYPLDGYSDISLDLTIRFLVNQLAAPLSGLDSTTLNVYVDSDPAIISGIIQPNYNGDFSKIVIPAGNDITTPIEIVLDYIGQYAPSDIIVVNVSVKERGIIPAIGIGNVLDQNGVLVGPNVVIDTINGLAEAEYDLILHAPLSTYLLSGVVVSPGYKLQDVNNNIFSIGVVGVQELIVNTIANKRSSSFSFITSQFYETLTSPIFSGYFQGVYLVDNLGDGYHINVTWHTARTTRPDYDIAYLIYYSTTRIDVFAEQPKLITQGRRLPQPETIQGADPQLFGFFAQATLPVGVTYYFGVRVTEYPHSTLPLIPADGYGSLSAGLIPIDGYSFKIPDIQNLSAAISGTGAIIVNVLTTKGYAVSGGYITLGNEIMRYTSLTPTSFIVASTGRGLFGTTIQSIHNIGESIGMYLGNSDENTVIEKGVVTWEPPNDPRRTRPDLITTDFTLEDANHAGFEFFDYCGYHRFRPDELLSDQQCGTYVGGEYNGHRGMFLYDRVLANEEQLLEVTGEPVILLRRMWNGETCICRTSRKDIARVRSCAICFGTGFKGGFVQYFNPRRDDQRIMVHFVPTDEEIAMKPQAGWDQTFAPGNWTIPVPALKDRDVLVRFDEYGSFDWMYIVDAVSRAKTMFGRYGRQRMKLSRLDKTDPIYTFKILL